MDRFEVAYQTQQYNYAVIYIPVWIDLKGSPSQLEKNKEKFTFQYG